MARRSKAASARQKSKNVVSNLGQDPAVRYVASGLAATILDKVTSRLSTRYPELTRFLREHLPLGESIAEAHPQRRSGNGKSGRSSNVH